MRRLPPRSRRIDTHVPYTTRFRRPNDAYVKMVDGEEEADLDKLITDCAAAADPTVDFTGVQGVNMMFNGDLDGYAWGGGACAVLDGTDRKSTRLNSSH